MLQRVRDFFGLKFAAQGAIDYPIYALLAISIVATSVLSWANFEDNQRILRLLLANIGSVGAVCLIIVGIDLILRRIGDDLQITLGALVLVGSALGATKGLFTSFGLMFLGSAAEGAIDLASRVVFSAISGLIVFPAVALFGSLRFRYSQQREALINEKVSIANGENYPATLVRFVAEAKKRLAKSGGSINSSALVTELRDIVNSDLRPLSQEIWRRESVKFPSFKLGRIALIAIRGPVYSIAWVVPLWAFSTLAATFRAFGYEEGLAIQLVRVSMLILALLVGKQIPVKSNSQSLFVYITTMTLVAAAQVVFGSFLSAERELGEGIGFMIANLVWLFQLTMFVGMAKAFIEMGQRVQSEYEESLGASDLEDLKKSRELALRDRQLAQFLHGSMQTKLSAVAARIEARQNSQSLSEDIEQIEQVLNEAVLEFGKQQVTDIEGIIHSLERDWGGLVRFSFAISPVELSQKQLEDVREVMNEGVANAVRHGFASRISVTLGVGPEITITDDGTGPRDGVPGLGSTYFDSISKDWELSATGVGSILRLNFD